MGNYNDDYNREMEARQQYEAEAEAKARAEADYYEQLQYENPDFVLEQTISVFVFKNFGSFIGEHVNWLINMKVELI